MLERQLWAGEDLFQLLLEDLSNWDEFKELVEKQAALNYKRYHEDYPRSIEKSEFRKVSSLLNNVSKEQNIIETNFGEQAYFTSYGKRVLNDYLKYFFPVKKNIQSSVDVFAPGEYSLQRPLSKYKKHYTYLKEHHATYAYFMHVFGLQSKLDYMIQFYDTNKSVYMTWRNTYTHLSIEEFLEKIRKLVRGSYYIVTIHWNPKFTEEFKNKSVVMDLDFDKYQEMVNFEISLEAICKFVVKWIIQKIQTFRAVVNGRRKRINPEITYMAFFSGGKGVHLYITSDKNTKQIIEELDGFDLHYTDLIKPFVADHYNHVLTNLSEMTFGNICEDYKGGSITGFMEFLYETDGEKYNQLLTKLLYVPFDKMNGGVSMFKMPGSAHANGTNYQVPWFYDDETCDERTLDFVKKTNITSHLKFMNGIN
jgi:hypothetical protein